MTMAFNSYTRSIQETAQQPQQPHSPQAPLLQPTRANARLSPEMEEFCQVLAEKTRIIFSSCDFLSRLVRRQYDQFVPLNEDLRRRVLHSAREASNAAQHATKLLEPHMQHQYYVLLHESFKLLGSTVFQFIRQVSVLLMKIPRPPNTPEVQQATDLMNTTRGQLRSCAENIKSFRQTQAQTGTGVESLKEFAALCKTTITMQSRIFNIAAHSDPEISQDPYRAEEVFIQLAGEFVTNIKTIIKFCMSKQLSVQEETLVDQSTRMISSAKLLFRTRSSYAQGLLTEDKDAVLDSLRTIIMEVSKYMKEGGSASPSPGSLTPPPSGLGARSVSPGRTLPTSQSFAQPSAEKPEFRDTRRQVSEIPVAPQKKEEEEYKPHLRGKLVQEIVETERNYVGNLGLVKSVYMIQMKYQKWLKEEEFEALFVNLDEIVGVNSRLLMLLQERIAQTGEDLSKAHVGKLFVDMAGAFLKYGKYINNFDAALKVLEQLQSRKPAAAFFQQMIEQGAGSQQLLDLGAYLIMPVQRLPRYELLLRELKKFTPSSHPDTYIDEALVQIKIVNAKINDMKREEENRMKWNAIRDTLTAERMLSPATGELIPGLNKNRWVLYQGSFDVAVLKKHQLNKGTQTDKIQKKTKMYVFLFDDMILFTEPKRKKYNIKYYVPIESKAVKISRDQKETLSVHHQDIIMGYTFEYVLHGSPQELQDFQQGLQGAIATAAPAEED
eukprot:CAMPEP_0201485580 /NCGR_PEP_ID=MMETSP0151_2-20130828/9670_1 /ASSEMBLY_ACC=CAM_ASM_000257 /TAXON_ID=200890 /ORGANISM="Paramoeba atlantica, Strain 621/1 / CCAP 1560/9" /LENGTH=721 /DNA_ID=CAMNT_0047869777 /DNA_START=92 /DNA_END=2257 /DNA_ORIENTATION=+